jgi:hypothetical protein
VSGVRANWHLADLDVSDDDPMQDIADVGCAIDLTRPDAEIIADIQSTFRVEHTLQKVHGTTCAIKANAASPPCWTCPQFRADSSPAGRLCALGRKQADLEHEAQSASRIRTDALARELAEVYLTREHAEGQELAAALL